jgi:hypothetical protein
MGTERYTKMKWPGKTSEKDVVQIFGTIFNTTPKEFLKAAFFCVKQFMHDPPAYMYVCVCYANQQATIWHYRSHKNHV